MDDPANRDPAGRFGAGNQANPSGRPKLVREYQDWLREHAWDKAKQALLKCLESEDEKILMMAVKEVSDRLVGKAPQAIMNEDGTSVSSMSSDIVDIIRKLGSERKSP
jgi:hypothetical protein